jgi:hypothetical protein
MDQGNVYKQGTAQSDSRPRRIPPAEERQQLISECHFMAHFGNTKCGALLAKRFYWYNMYQDIADFIKNCSVCKERKAHFITYPELQSVEPTGLFTMVAVDTLGAFPTSAKGNKYLALCVEYYSRWVEARALPDIKSSTLAKFFEEEIICRHGVPAECITDNGGSFQLDFSRLMTKYNIQHKHSAPFHPQGNGLVERCNQWMLRALQRKAADDPTSWDEHVHSALWGLSRLCAGKHRLQPLLCGIWQGVQVAGGIATTTEGIHSATTFRRGAAAGGYYYSGSKPSQGK